MLGIGSRNNTEVSFLNFSSHFYFSQHLPLGFNSDCLRKVESIVLTDTDDFINIPNESKFLCVCFKPSPEDIFSLDF